MESDDYPARAMTDPQLHHVICPEAEGSHRMAYWQWGDPRAPHVVVCVHGLTRQGRDFDVLAAVLLARAGGALRVVCPDVAGRGHSDWLKNPALYQVPTYAADMLALLAQLHAQSPVSALDWVGTSMGGLIGMAVSGTPQLPLPAPVRRLVLNDVGPALRWEALLRIKGYVGKTGHFESVEQAADAMWAIASGFGPHTRDQWLALSRPMLRPHPDGGYTLHYDPNLSATFAGMTPEGVTQGEAALWAVYDAITARTLLLRGQMSDLLDEVTAHAMTQRGPRARLHEFEGVGHAPTLVAPGQSAVVADFLLSG